MKKIIYEGKENGIYEFPGFAFKLNMYDRERDLKANDISEEGVARVVAHLPKYRVTVTYEGKMGERAKVSLEGEQIDVDNFERILSVENSRLLKAIGASK